MLTDKLGRQFVKGQKVVFYFTGLMEVDVLEVREVALASKQNPRGNKALILGSTHTIVVPADAGALPDFFIVQDPTEKASKILDA